MTPALEVVWSGAKERAGESGGLSSPYIGSAARLCMELGTRAISEEPEKPRYPPGRVMTCFSCRGRFNRTHRERLCATCYVRLHAPARFER
jgi:hypothetical protein